jgi:hypothetical protein
MLNTNFQKVSALPSVPEPDMIYQVGNLLYSVGKDLVPIPMGSAVMAAGQTTLVAGTKVITIPGLLTGSLAFVQLVSTAHANTVERQAVCTANTLTITALVAAKTINASDVAVVNYVVFQ